LIATGDNRGSLNPESIIAFPTPAPTANKSHNSSSLNGFLCTFLLSISS
jgi:hypothetical protein